MTSRLYTISIDARDPAALGTFWRGVLGGELSVDEDGDAWLDYSDGRAAELLFIADRGHKSEKNRIHFDLIPDDRDAEVERVLALGASRVDIGQTGLESWVVMADPEGNEFCILSPDEDAGD